MSISGDSEVEIPVGRVSLKGNLFIPVEAEGIVISRVLLVEEKR